MADVDTRPEVVNITHYAGDTLTISVTAPASVVEGQVWSAQVRPSRDPTAPLDATFTITPPTVADGPAFLVLSSVDCARLAGTGVVVQRTWKGTTYAVQTYTGEWDCQVAAPGGPDPVRTLVQGTLTIEADVTRE